MRARSAPTSADAFVMAAEALQTKPKQPRLATVWVAVLAEVPLFASLSKRHQRRIARLATAVSYRTGATIVWRDGPGDAFYLILDGEVEVHRETGEPIVLQRGAFFGELALIDGKPRSAAVRARSPVAAMRLDRAAFRKLLRDEPAIAVGLLQELAARLRRIESPQR